MVERASVDERMARWVEGDRHLVVFGGSKQGKSSLIEQHVVLADRVDVRCDADSSKLDLYRQLLRKAGIKIETRTIEEAGTGAKAGVKVSIIARLKALVAETEVGAEGSAEVEETKSQTREWAALEYNLSIAADVAQLLVDTGFEKTIVFENFHVLAEPVQRALASDLRTFADEGIQCIVIGVWKESNRLCMYRGDLQDRIEEVPVDPWETDDLLAVLEAGEPELHIRFSDAVSESLVENSLHSVGILQELAVRTVRNHGVEETVEDEIPIDNMDLVNAAVDDLAEGYRMRTWSSLTALARAPDKDGELPDPKGLLTTFVRAIFAMSPEELAQGVPKALVFERMAAQVPPGTTLLETDVARVLERLGHSQFVLGIEPPIFSYDSRDRRLYVVDKTALFFLANIDRDEEAKELPVPSL